MPMQNRRRKNDQNIQDVRRKKAVFEYDEYGVGMITLEMMDVLMDMIAKASWIPCSERLPEQTGFYLIQHSRKYCEDEMAVAFYSVEEAKSDDDYTWEFETLSDVQEVVAWMPLPKPYKEEQE